MTREKFKRTECVELLKELMVQKYFLSPGHDGVVTIKSRNFSIAKVRFCSGLY